MQLLGLLRRELRSECRQWVDDGDISAEQGDRILARYGTSLDDGGDGSLAYKVLVGVALLFVGMALLLLVSANWEEIPRGVRMLGLISTTLILNGIGIYHYLKIAVDWAGYLWGHAGRLDHADRADLPPGGALPRWPLLLGAGSCAHGLAGAQSGAGPADAGDCDSVDAQ